MKTILLLEILVLGVFLFGLIIGFVYFCIKERSFLDSIISISGILLFGFFPFNVLYFDVNKYFSKPEPTNKIERHINGITYIQYQDTTYLCYASDENSTVFTSLTSFDRKMSQTDTCIYCKRSFLNHNTISEYRFWKILYDISEHVCMYY